jgi:hypothetical protein
MWIAVYTQRVGLATASYNQSKVTDEESCHVHSGLNCNAAYRQTTPSRLHGVTKQRPKALCVPCIYFNFLKRSQADKVCVGMKEIRLGVLREKGKTMSS